MNAVRCLCRVQRTVRWCWVGGLCSHRARPRIAVSCRTPDQADGTRRDQLRQRDPGGRVRERGARAVHVIWQGRRAGGAIDSSVCSRHTWLSMKGGTLTPRSFQPSRRVRLTSLPPAIWRPKRPILFRRRPFAPSRTWTRADAHRWRTRCLRFFLQRNIRQAHWCAHPAPCRVWRLFATGKLDSSASGRGSKMDAAMHPNRAYDGGFASSRRSRSGRDAARCLREFIEDVKHPARRQLEAQGSWCRSRRAPVQ